jgi:hypothetical protein
MSPRWARVGGRAKLARESIPHDGEARRSVPTPVRRFPPSSLSSRGSYPLPISITRARLIGRQRSCGVSSCVAVARYTTSALPRSGDRTSTPSSRPAASQVSTRRRPAWSGNPASARRVVGNVYTISFPTLTRYSHTGAVGQRSMGFAVFATDELSELGSVRGPEVVTPLSDPAGNRRRALSRHRGIRFGFLVPARDSCFGRQLQLACLAQKGALGVFGHRGKRHPRAAVELVKYLSHPHPPRRQEQRFAFSDQEAREGSGLERLGLGGQRHDRSFASVSPCSSVRRGGHHRLATQGSQG